MATTLALLWHRADPVRFTCGCGKRARAVVVIHPCEAHPRGLVEPRPCAACAKVQERRRRRKRPRRAETGGTTPG